MTFLDSQTMLLYTTTVDLKLDVKRKVDITQSIKM